MATKIKMSFVLKIKHLSIILVLILKQIPNEKNLKEKIETIVQKIAEETAKLSRDVSEKVSSFPKFGPLSSGGFGTFMEIEHLTDKPHPGTKGSGPTSSKHKVHDILKLRKAVSDSYYVKGHLLNNELGGPGIWRNLTPFTNSVNTLHSTKIEEPLKKASEEKLYYYRVDIEYGRSPITLKRAAGETDDSFKTKQAIATAEQYVPKLLKATYYEVGKEGSKQVVPIKNEIKQNSSADYVLKGDTVIDTRINLSSDKVYDSSKVATELGITKKWANLILKHRTYTNGSNLKTKVLDAMKKSTRFSEAEAEKWEKEAKALTKKWCNNNKGKIKYAE